MTSVPNINNLITFADAITFKYVQRVCDISGAQVTMACPVCIMTAFVAANGPAIAAGIIAAGTAGKVMTDPGRAALPKLRLEIQRNDRVSARPLLTQASPQHSLTVRR